MYTYSKIYIYRGFVQNKTKFKKNTFVMSKGCYCCDLSIMYYPFLSIMYAYVLSYVRFNLKVRFQGLLKHVPAVHARGNTWGGFLLCFAVLDGIVVTASVFALSCR